MIQRIAIPVDTIIKKVIDQCSQDFRGLRTQKPDIDILFQDFVITPDDKGSLIEEIKHVVTDIQLTLKDYICQWYIDEEVCFYFKTCADILSVENKLCNTIVFSVLAWWYNLRLPELSNVYRDKSINNLSDLQMAITPKFGKRKLRMF